jgi:hypothetical protein
MMPADTEKSFARIQARLDKYELRMEERQGRGRLRSSMAHVMVNILIGLSSVGILLSYRALKGFLRFCSARLPLMRMRRQLLSKSLGLDLAVLMVCPRFSFVITWELSLPKYAQPEWTRDE